VSRAGQPADLAPDDLDERGSLAVPAVEKRGRRRRTGAAALDAGVVTALTTAVLVVVLRLWEAAPKIPFSYPGPWSREFFAGDATFHLKVARALEQGEWWWRPNQHLGAPFGQDLRDFPLGPDHLHVVLLKGLVTVLGDPFAAVNAYYLLGYPLVALSAWGVLRLMGISRPVAIVVGVLFAFLPYHAGKGPEHLFLANYVAVPLAGLLLHWHLTGRTAWGPARRGSAPGLTRRRLLGVLLCVLVLGSGSAYYGLHFVVLLGVVTGLQVLAQRDWRPLLSAALLAAPVLVVLVVNTLAALVGSPFDGPNTGLQRSAQHSWFFAMNPSQLLMPVEGHRWEVLDQIGQSQREASGWQEPGNSLGLLGVVTVLGLAVVLARRVSHGKALDSSRARFRERQAGLTVLAVFVATAGGGSLVIGLAGLGQARVWARMSIYVAFFVLSALATWLDDALDRFRTRAPGRLRWAAWPALAGLLAFGVWDQTTPADVPAYEEVRAAFGSDNAFMREVVDLLGEDAMVWQIPQVLFPEGGLRYGTMYDYDLFKGYLHAPELRWSYGALKSRPASSWQPPVSRQRLDEQLTMVAAVGFSAVYVDTFGLPDRGRPLVAELERLLEQEPRRSDDERLVLFDLRPFADRFEQAVGPRVSAAAADDLLRRRFGHAFGEGFRAPGIEDHDGRYIARDSAQLVLQNPGEAADVELDLMLRAADGTRTVRLRGAGLDEVLEVGRQNSFRLPISLQRGETVVQVTIDEPAPEGRSLFLGDVLVLGPQLRQVLDVCAGDPDTAALRC
jgi:hypothetical protein